MSTITSSIDLLSSRSRVHVIPQRVHRGLLFSSSARKPQLGFTAANPSLLSLSISQRCSALSRSNAKMNKIVCNVSGAPTPSGSPSWHKWGPLQIIKNRVDMVMNTVEAVAEVVEAVAHKVEEVADDIADKLPEDGKLKSAFEAVEAIAKETAKDAHMVDELIENVEAVEDKVEDFFESAMHGAGDQKTKVDSHVGGEEGNNITLSIGQYDKKKIVFSMIENLIKCRPNPHSFSAWKHWMVGLTLSILLPSLRHKGGSFLALKKKVDVAMETAESVTEVVEELAEEVEKVSEQVAEKLPDDAKLKKAMESVEHLAEEAVEKAKLAEDIIHKVKEVEEEVEEALISGSEKKNYTTHFTNK
ncbi:hypothetical protein ACLB2K_007883 [Fragaria x ananassa]